MKKKRKNSILKNVWRKSRNEVFPETYIVNPRGITFANYERSEMEKQHQNRVVGWWKKKEVAVLQHKRFSASVAVRSSET